MADLDIVVEGDHLDRLARATAVVALSELVWNSLDAEATTVAIAVHPAPLAGEHGVGDIVVADNGHGIPPNEVESTFGHLGGSWKAHAARSKSGKVALHGRAGQGRFRALSLGNVVEWKSVAATDTGAVASRIRIHRGSLKRCRVDEPLAVSSPVGTTVTISDPSPAAHGLAAIDGLRAKLTGVFALRLMETPDLAITVNGVRLDPGSVQNHVETYTLEVPGVGEGPIELDIIEWSVEIDRALHLCDDDGFSLHAMPPGIHAPTFNFTAYVRWAGFRTFENILTLGDMSADVAPVIRAAQERMREHFRMRADQRDTRVVEGWKDEGAYPYDDRPPVDAVEDAERQVFDLIALTVNAANPGFARSDSESRRVTLRLLREAVERSPESIHRILQEITRLDDQRLDELATILESTPLSNIIGATRRVTDRLDFLHALDMLLFDIPDQVTERDHLHRILERELWLFGDHYEGAISERGLTNVLREHLRVLARSDLVSEPVRLEDGRLGRVDLMLSAKMAGRGRLRAEHLVVELKAPHVKLTTTEVGQIEQYATAVMTDARFHGDQTFWEFWLIGNELDETVRRRAEQQQDRQPGLIDFGANYRIWVYAWSRLLEDHRRRLLFMKDALEHEARDDAALSYLQRTHSKYLPVSLREGSDISGVDENDVRD